MLLGVSAIVVVMGMLFAFAQGLNLLSIIAVMGGLVLAILSPYFTEKSTPSIKQSAVSSSRRHYYNKRALICLAIILFGIMDMYFGILTHGFDTFMWIIILPILVGICLIFVIAANWPGSERTVFNKTKPKTKQLKSIKQPK